MNEFVVYTVPGSPFARAVLAGLKEKGLAYRIAPLGLGESKGEAHLARHPFGRMPVIEHGDFSLYETQAILRYLERVAPEPSLVPENDLEEARMNQLIGISDWYVFNQISAPITFNRFVAPKLGLPADAARVTAALPAARVCIGALEDLIGDKPYLAASIVTIADLMIGAQLELFAATEEGAHLFSRAPRLSAWLKRMTARQSFAETSWEHFGGGKRVAA